MARRLILLLVTLVVAGAVAGVAAAGAGGSAKLPLLGQDGSAFCDGSGVVSGTANGYGFAVINYDTDTNTVLATVSLKGLDPNTTYGVRLIQGQDDCFTTDGTFTTNGQGNGNISVSEPSVSSHALVAVDDSNFDDSYVTQTYNH
jgi:hypothetical protein